MAVPARMGALGIDCTGIRGLACELRVLHGGPLERLWGKARVRQRERVVAHTRARVMPEWMSMCSPSCTKGSHLPNTRAMVPIRHGPPGERRKGRRLGSRSLIGSNEISRFPRVLLPVLWRIRSPRSELRRQQLVKTLRGTNLARHATSMVPELVHLHLLLVVAAVVVGGAASGKGAHQSGPLPDHLLRFFVCRLTSFMNIFQTRILLLIHISSLDVIVPLYCGEQNDRQTIVTLTERVKLLALMRHFPLAVDLGKGPSLIRNDLLV